MKKKSLKVYLKELLVKPILIDLVDRLLPVTCHPAVKGHLALGVPRKTAPANVV